MRGTRIGDVRQLFLPQNTDPDVMKRMEQALADLRRLGAAIVDPVAIAEIDSIPPPMLFCFRFKFDINEYLPRRAPDAQVQTLQAIIKSGKFQPSIGSGQFRAYSSRVAAVLTGTAYLTALLSYPLHSFSRRPCIVQQDG